jgi:hypothetical protein
LRIDADVILKSLGSRDAGPQHPMRCCPTPRECLRVNRVLRARCNKSGDICRVRPGFQGSDKARTDPHAVHACDKRGGHSPSCSYAASGDNRQGDHFVDLAKQGLQTYSPADVTSRFDPLRHDQVASRFSSGNRLIA